MDARAKRRRWLRRCRVAFRACRITVLVLVLALVVLGAYLNEVGLPDFLKRPLQTELRARGLDLQFSRLRLRWNRGVVAEDVQFGGTQAESNAPQLSLKEVEVKFDHAALARFHVRIDRLILEQGRLLWPVPETNGPARQLEATNIQAQLRFLTNDQWELDHFTAAFAGAQLEVSGSVTNASQLQSWKVFQPQPGTVPGLFEERLRQFADTLDRLKFAAPPELTVRFDGDARDPQTFGGSVSLKAPGAETPWGKLTRGELSAWLTPPGAATNQYQADVELRAVEAVTGVGRVRNLKMRLHAEPEENLTNVIQARVEASAGELITKWAQVSGGTLHAEWTHALTNWIPQSGNVELELTNARIDRANAGALELSARLNPPDAAGAPATDERWSWWAAFAPYSFDWNCRLKDIHAEDPAAGVFEFKELACGGFWRAPELTLTNAHAELYRGKVDAHATLNVVTRAATFAGTEDFDVLKVEPLLTEGARRWMEQYTWETPPLVHAAGGVILPEWTNKQPDWRGEVRPTLWLSGDVAAGNGGFRGVPVDSASLHFYYTNMLWTVPDLVAERPEGKLLLSDESNDRTERFHFHINSTLDPKALRGLVPPEAQPVMDWVIFTQPPVVEAEIWGHWHELDSIGVAAHVAVTNFALRGESATRVEANVRYTNEFITLTDGRLETGERYATADGFGVDIAGRRGFVTNGFSTIEPRAFFHVVGGKVAKVMEPYQFSEAPTVHADGTIPFAEDVMPDLHFQVDGGPFHWLLFNVAHISGNVDWVGKHLALTNVDSEFYQGRLKADAAFDFTPVDGAYFAFNVAVTNTSLQQLMADVSVKTNKLEGLLTGNLNITSAYTENSSNWMGRGQVNLRDGLVWEIPVFGIFSPVLDKVSPGLGESRAKKASATFTILNSVIYSDDLEIQAPVLEMLYRGTVDFKGRVNATLEAQLFRQLPLGVGTVVNTVFKPLTWLFQYKVTGTLSDPKSEPQFPVARFPLMLFNPMQSLRDLTPAQNTPDTNAPATNTPDMTTPATNAPPAMPDTPGQ